MSSLPGPSTSTVNPYKPFPVQSQKVSPLKNKLRVNLIGHTQNERYTFVSTRPFAPTFVKARLSKSKNLDVNALYEQRIKSKQTLLENIIQKSKPRLKHKDAMKKISPERRREFTLPLTGRWRLDEDVCK